MAKLRNHGEACAAVESPRRDLRAGDHTAAGDGRDERRGSDLSQDGFLVDVGRRRIPLCASPIADVSVWQRAKWFRISAGGRPLIELQSEGDAFFHVISDLAACARGEQGWWGKGATEPIRRVK
jgi:hypothetical protein